MVTIFPNYLKFKGLLLHEWVQLASVWLQQFITSCCTREWVPSLVFHVATTTKWLWLWMLVVVWLSLVYHTIMIWLSSKRFISRCTNSNRNSSWCYNYRGFHLGTNFLMTIARRKGNWQPTHQAIALTS